MDRGRQAFLVELLAAGILVAITACEQSTTVDDSLASSGDSKSTTEEFEWPGEGEDSPDLAFPSAQEAVEFLSAEMDVAVALPAWVPPSVDLDTEASVLLATVNGRKQAQVKLTTRRGSVWGIQYGVAMLDGCAPEASRSVTVSGKPGRLRVSVVPEDSSGKWTELIWPATLHRPVGMYGLYGLLSPRAILAMSESMPVVTSRPDSVVLNC